MAPGTLQAGPAFRDPASLPWREHQLRVVFMTARSVLAGLMLLPLIFGCQKAGTEESGGAIQNPLVGEWRVNELKYKSDVLPGHLAKRLAINFTDRLFVKSHAVTCGANRSFSEVAARMDAGLPADVRMQYFLEDFGWTATYQIDLTNSTVPVSPKML
jgi:hypothetical protein